MGLQGRSWNKREAESSLSRCSNGRLGKLDSNSSRKEQSGHFLGAKKIEEHCSLQEMNSGWGNLYEKFKK